jgi:hypothetical protein
LAKPRTASPLILRSRPTQRSLARLCAARA